MKARKSYYENVEYIRDEEVTSKAGELFYVCYILDGKVQRQVVAPGWYEYDELAFPSGPEGHKVNIGYQVRADGKSVFTLTPAE